MNELWDLIRLYPLPWRAVNFSLIDAEGKEITKVDTAKFAHFLALLSHTLRELEEDYY